MCRKHHFQEQLYCCMRIRCPGKVFTDPLLQTGCITPLFICPLHDNGCTRHSIKMDLREIEWGGMDWIDLAQDRDQ
jgi:hypothetical protein